MKKDFKVGDLIECINKKWYGIVIFLESDNNKYKKNMYFSLQTKEIYYFDKRVWKIVK